MTPTTTGIDLTGVMGQALNGLLLIPVIWYMLRDLRADSAAIRKDLDHGLKAMTDRMSKIELSVASDATKHDVRNLKENFKELQDDVEKMREQLREQGRTIAVLVARIGDCPDEIKRLGGAG